MDENTTPQPDAPAADAPPAQPSDPDATMPGLSMETGPLEDVHGVIATAPAPAAPVFERRSFGRPSADAPMVVTVH